MANDFPELMEQVRLGSEEAVATLLDDYGSTIRRAIRMQMLDSRLQRVIGESDIFQSVVSRFLFDLWAGRFEFESPQHLAALLRKMAEARVIDAARHHTAQRRDIRRDERPSADDMGTVRGRIATASQIVGNRELLQAALDLMSEQERDILHRRQNRDGWDQIAADLGKSAEAVRKQYERAIERVATQLRIGESVVDQ